MTKNFARLRVLKTGRAIGNDWQVLTGLKPGDRLIVEGLAKVMPDMPVNPQPVLRRPDAPDQHAGALMALSRFFIDRPVFAWVIAIVIMLAGGIAVTHPADRAISHHRAARGGDQRHLSRRRRRDAAELRHPGDRAAAHRPGQPALFLVASPTPTARCQITATFAPGTNPDIAQVQVQNKVQQAVPLLPAAGAAAGRDGGQDRSPTSWS